ncbi:MAG: tRNA uridine-5-carboxymethylaminomethyl(34) synthesis GTPase MnmE [Hyphomicrobiales bacterium]
MYDLGSSDTIYALSSGLPPAGVAVIRLSGPHCRFALETMKVSIPDPRKAVVRKLFSARNGSLLDEALVLYFKAPASFTGEDVIELHCHGGRAVVEVILRELSLIDGLRLAEPGEFTKRAFYEDRINLVAVEGLSDLINAETESQRQLALYQTAGGLADTYDSWRAELIRLRSYLEAEFDFPDEDDVPGSVSEQVWSRVQALAEEMERAIGRSQFGERIRDGVNIVLAGKPNAGKSSLLNVLSRRDVAIVSAQSGTTRDILDVNLDLSGVAVRLSDTAGLRETDDEVEKIGVQRARTRLSEADLILYLVDCRQPTDLDGEEFMELKAAQSDMLTIGTKIDQVPAGELNSIRSRFDMMISSTTHEGIDNLLLVLQGKAKALTGNGESLIAIRERHRIALQGCVDCLKNALIERPELELRAEELRKAADVLAKVTGRVDVDDLLDVIFREFCIGK